MPKAFVLMFVKIEHGNSATNLSYKCTSDSGI
jgi:hypothetical protein